MSQAETFPIELESRNIDCRTEDERTMLVEARNISCDNRISERHSTERLRAISAACHEYGLQQMGDMLASLAEQFKN